MLSMEHCKSDSMAICCSCPAHSLQSAGVCTSQGELRNQRQAQQQPEVPRASEVVDGSAESPQDGGVQRRHGLLAKTQRICAVLTVIYRRTECTVGQQAIGCTQCV